MLFHLINDAVGNIVGLFHYNLFFYLYFVFLFIYFVGLFGVLFNIKNILISLLLIEVAYFGIIGLLLFLAVFFDLIFGFVFALLVLLVAAAESVMGLGFVIIIFRFQRTITYESLTVLQA
jgi:NADH-quinone oxidoreductase subunit K